METSWLSFGWIRGLPYVIFNVGTVFDFDFVTLPGFVGDDKAAAAMSKISEDGLNSSMLESCSEMHFDPLCPGNVRKSNFPAISVHVALLVGHNVFLSFIHPNSSQLLRFLHLPHSLYIQPELLRNPLTE